MRSLILFFIFPLFVLGQENQKQRKYLDSIYQILDTIQDPEQQFLSTNQIAENNLKKRPKIGIAIGKRMLLEAERENNHRKKTSALYILGRGYFNNQQPMVADSIYKASIKYELSFSPPDTAKLAWVYHNAANYYKKRGNYTKAIELFEKSLNLEEKRGHLENQASCHLNIGAMYLYLGQNKKAIAPLTKSKSISFSIGDTATAQSCLNNIAIIYQDLGDYTKALNLLDSAALYAKRPYDKAYVYGDRATIYHEMGNIDKAVFYYKKAEKAFDESGSLLEKARVLMSIAELFHSQGHYSRALQMYRNAQSIFSSLKNKDFQAKVLLNIGRLYGDMPEQDSSLYYYKKALSIAKASGNITFLGDVNLSLGKYYKKTEHYTKAISYFDAAINYFQESGSNRKIIKTNVYLAQCLNASGNKKQAVKHIKEAQKDLQKMSNQSLDLNVEVLNTIIKDFYYAYSPKELRDLHIKLENVKDSLRSEENAKAVAQLSANYQLKEMVDSIRYTKNLLVQQREINAIESKARKQQSLLVFIIGGGSLLLVVLLIVLYINRRKIKSRNAENELLLGEIHHRVKNNLQVISSLLSLQEKNLTDTTAKKALSDGKSRVKSIGLIHKLLYQKDQFSGISIKEYTQNIIYTIAATHGYDSNDYNVHFEVNSIEVDADTAIPIGLIINELINNTFKYAFSKEKTNNISIIFNSTGDNYSLEYSDNGKGEKSALESSNSFGYRMIISLTKQLKGSISVEQKDGLAYSFRIPKK